MENNYYKEKNYSVKETINVSFGYFKKFKLLFSLTIVFGIFRSVFVVVLPFYLQYFIDFILCYMTSDHKISSYFGAYDYILTPGDLTFQFEILLLYFFLLAAFSSLETITINVFRLKLNNDFRTKIAKKINNIDIYYFDYYKHGDIMERLTNNTQNVTDFLPQICTVFVTVPILLIGVFTICFIYSWVLFLFTFCCVILSIVVSVFINKFRYKHNVEAAKIDGELFGHINESIYALHTVNLYNKKDKTIDKFDLLNQRSNKLSIKSDFISAFGLFINNIFSYVIQLGVIIIGIFMVINGTNLSIIPSIILLSTYFNSPINQISDFFSNFSNFYSSANRLYNFLAIPEIKKQTGEEQKNLSYVGNIEFKNITFSYKKDVPVLENVNLSIPAGRKIAIVGETGSGKTTITSLLMRFYRVDKGEITIDGININDMTEDELYRYISIVQQEPWVFYGSIMENLKYNTNVSEQEVKDLCRKLDIEHIFNSFPHGYDSIIFGEITLSHGEKQLLTIVRAILQNHKVIIFDEATSNIDSKIELTIKQAISELFKDKTSITIAHRLSTIVEADCIYVLNKGKLVEAGTHQELLEKGGIYKTMYEQKFEEN